LFFFFSFLTQAAGYFFFFQADLPCRYPYRGFCSANVSLPGPVLSPHIHLTILSFFLFFNIFKVTLFLDLGSPLQVEVTLYLLLPVFSSQLSTYFALFSLKIKSTRSHVVVFPPVRNRSSLRSTRGLSSFPPCHIRFFTAGDSSECFPLPFRHFSVSPKYYPFPLIGPFPLLLLLSLVGFLPCASFL